MSLPFISVVIPTFNRPEQIKACMKSLSMLEYPRDAFEVIVVDDGSPQPVLERRNEETADLNLAVVRQNRKGPAQARNAGLEKARGTLVAFTDDDCRPRPGWLTALAAAHKQYPEAAFAGPVRNALTHSIPSEASQLLVDYCCRYFNHRQNGMFYPSNNLAFPRQRLEDLGGFDVTFPLAAGEDRELCARWAQHGLEIVNLTHADVDHYHLLTTRKFLKQHFNYGRGAWHFHLARAAQADEEVKLEPMRFYTGMMRSALRQPFPRSAPLLVLLGLSQAMTAIGYFFERGRNRSERMRRGKAPYSKWNNSSKDLRPPGSSIQIRI